MKVSSHPTLIITILIILYVVGLVGILFPQTRGVVLPLSSVNLFLGFLLLSYSEKKSLKSLLIFMAIAFIIGFCSELIGVQTGILFGNYSYGTNLGIKFIGVPLIIGLNWAVLTVTSASITEGFSENIVFRVVINSLIMVLFDFVMEPVAVKFDFWSWHSNEIPVYNYVCWFLISVILQFIYLTYFTIKSNIVYKTLFIVQFLFFLFLNLF
ncbi:MAG: carotenoid biosynthesis protein [Bacteroidetes bacterium]|nr:carotenoid biosynthesis protein [Bacteroidota bacterium]